MLTGDITITEQRKSQVPSKNCAPFAKCITRIMEQQQMMLRI